MELIDGAIDMCRLCGGNELIEKFTSNGHKIFKCSDCDMLQVRELGEYEYLYGEEYFTNQKYNNVNALNKEHKRRSKLLLKYLNKSATVLDIGCASGEFVDYAKDTFDIYGCDFAEAAIKVGKERFPHLTDRLYVQSAIHTRERKESYDAVCMWDVIEHLPYPMQAVSEALNKVKPSGYIFLSTPYPDALFAKIAGKFWPFMTPPEHLCFIGKNGMQCIANTIPNLTLISTKAKGKWANIGFIMYKAKRVITWVPNSILKCFQHGVLSKLSLYVPTKDIVYVVFQKDENFKYEQ